MSIDRDNLPNTAAPAPVGWGDHESRALDREARRISAVRGLPKEERAAAVVPVPKPRPVAQPRPTSSGRWCIVVRRDRRTVKRTFDTAEQAAAWRDQITKEGR